MKFERIDLADCTTPEQLLTTINKLQGGIFPLPVPVDEWALALDIVSIKTLETEGFEGGLLRYEDGSSGVILVNQNNSRQRRRFTIGHELGHFLLPWHTPRHGQGFMCSKKDMSVFSAQRGVDRYMEMGQPLRCWSAYACCAVPCRFARSPQLRGHTHR